MHNDKVIAPELDKIDMIKELLHVKFGLSVLPYFGIADIDIIVELLCTEQCFFFLLLIVYVLFLFDFHNKYNLFHTLHLPTCLFCASEVATVLIKCYCTSVAGLCL